MRRIGFRQVSAIGLRGMISALALAAAAPAVLAQATETPAPAAAAAPEASEPAAPATPSPAPEPAANADAGAPVTGPSTAPAQEAAAPAASPPPAEAQSSGVRSGGTPARPNQTRYSKRQKGGMGAGAASADAAKPDTPTEVVCRAGCDQLPGSVVHVQPKPQTAAVPAADDDDDEDTPKAKQQAQAKPGEPMLTCVAGCFDSTTSTFAGVPNATEGGYTLTKSKLPSAKPASGEWLVRINRERGSEPGK